MELIGSRFRRLIKGDVHFTVLEGFPSLLLKECKKNGIRLRYVLIRSDTVEAITSESEFKTVLSVASSLGMRVEIHSKRGLPSVIMRYRHRYGLPVGLLLFSVLLAVLSSFVWSVEVEGLNTVNAEAFSDYLRSNHVCQGIFLCNVDTNSIEALAERYDPHIKKSEVNLVGSRLIVRLIERETPPEMTDESRCGDLIAERGGEILNADISAGIKKIREGDAVVAGDVLAEGMIPLSDGTFRATRAQGTVIARTHRQLSCMSAQKPVLFLTDRWNVRNQLCFFGCEFPLSVNRRNKDRNIHTTESVFYIRSGDHAFPVGIKKIGILKLAEREISLDRKQTMLLCATDLALRFCGSLEHVNVVSFTEQKSKSGITTLEADYVCEENIAKPDYYISITD